MTGKRITLLLTDEDFQTLERLKSELPADTNETAFLYLLREYGRTKITVGREKWVRAFSARGIEGRAIRTSRLNKPATEPQKVIKIDLKAGRDIFKK